MSIFKLSGYAFIAFVALAALVPGVAVPSLLLSVVSVALWLIGECAPQNQEETNL